MGIVNSPGWGSGAAAAGPSEGAACAGAGAAAIAMPERMRSLDRKSECIVKGIRGTGSVGWLDQDGPEGGGQVDDAGQKRELRHLPALVGARLRKRQTVRDQRPVGVQDVLEAPLVALPGGLGAGKS